MDNPLVPQNSPPSRPTWKALSEDLKSLLLAGRSDVIQREPSLLAEAERHLGGLRDDVYRPAEPEDLKLILGQRFAVFPQPERIPAEWAAWWADYTDALSDLGAPALEAAMASYVKEPDAEFFPKPGRIRELAKTVPNRASLTYYAAQRAVSSARQAAALAEPTPEQPKTEPADKAKVAQMLSEYHRKVNETRPAAKPDRPPTPVATDEHGVSAIMRAHLERNSMAAE
jgi:hypothetical protein